jgi:hypothetical protein
MRGDRAAAGVGSPPVTGRSGTWTETPRERTVRHGRCPGPHDGAPAPGDVGLDLRAPCCTCGRRVSVTPRGRYAHHRPTTTDRGKLKNAGRSTDGRPRVPYFPGSGTTEATRHLRLTADRHLARRASVADVEEAIRIWQDAVREAASLASLASTAGKSRP